MFRVEVEYSFILKLSLPFTTLNLKRIHYKAIQLRIKMGSWEFLIGRFETEWNMGDGCFERSWLNCSLAVRVTCAHPQHGVIFTYYKHEIACNWLAAFQQQRRNSTSGARRGKVATPQTVYNIPLVVN